MRKLTQLTSTAVPIMNANVDTDIITPMNRITTRSDRPLSYYAFEPLRYIDGNGDSGQMNVEFPLNKGKYKGAEIMICGENFGCGSSSETAPAAIVELGFRVLIGSSFGDIFFNNCFQQGLLPIILSLDTTQRLATLATMARQFSIDLPAQSLTTPEGTISFAVNSLRKKSLIEGLDDIGLTLRQTDLIDKWQAEDRLKRPWVYNV